MKCPNCGWVHDYQQENCEDEYDETKEWTAEDWKVYYDELREEEEDRRAETAATCTCGAWVFSKVTGNVIHVADCICGAE